MRVVEIFRSIQGEGLLTGTDSLFVRTSGCNLRCAYCDTPYASRAPEGTDLAVEEILGRLDQLSQLRWHPPATIREPRHVSLGAKAPQHASVGRRSTNGSTAGGHASAATTDRQTVVRQAPADVRHVVITGGEPMLFPELVSLATALRAAGHHITIETAGTRLLPVACDLMSISPKCSNSTPSSTEDADWVERHESRCHAPEVIRSLVADYDYQMKFVVATLADCKEVETYLSAFPEIDRGRVMLMPRGTDVDELAETGQWLEPYCQQHALTFCPRRQVEWFGRRRGT